MGTTITYKLFKKDKKGNLHPLYVNKKMIYEIGKWYDAEIGELLPNGKVKGLGTGLALRPGFHSSEYPVALHIGKNLKNGKPTIRPANQVWCKCEIRTDINYQPEADSKSENPKYKCLKTIPVGGFYKFKTSPNMYKDWYISGELKIIEIMTDEQVKIKNDETGVYDLPREK